MKRLLIIFVCKLLFLCPIDAQKRIIDATDKTPISSASILDASGNMIGFTFNDGIFSEIPESAYPITVRCLGYEQLVIERSENKTWEMTPTAYALEEVVIVPAERNIMRQTFYVREYYSMYNSSDTITFFFEHMADRFVPNSKDAKFRGKSSLRILKSNSYSRYKVSEKDSVVANPKSAIPSLLTILELSDKEVSAPESFKETGKAVKLYEKTGKSGVSLIQKQNDRTFTMIGDLLAEDEDHKYSPWPLKLLGCTMEFNQLYLTHVYRVNDKGIYLSKDLEEASFIMEADGRGKYLRQALESDKPIIIRYLIEFYIADRDYLTKEEAKKKYKNKPADVDFVIPSTVPQLNEATLRLVERAKAESKIKK